MMENGLESSDPLRLRFEKKLSWSLNDVGGGEPKWILALLLWKWKVAIYKIWGHDFKAYVIYTLDSLKDNRPKAEFLTRTRL